MNQKLKYNCNQHCINSIAAEFPAEIHCNFISLSFNRKIVPIFRNCNLYANVGCNVKNRLKLKQIIMKEQTLNNETCPIHKLEGKYIPPTKTDKRNGKLIIRFLCPENHTFIVEKDLK